MREHIQTITSERHSTHIQSWGNTSQQPYRKGSALTSDHEGTHPNNPIKNVQHLYPPMREHIPTTMMEGLCTYIHPWGNTSQQQWWKGSTLTSTHKGTHPNNNDGRALHLHPPMREHSPTTRMEGLALISAHEGTHPNSHIRMPPSPRLSYMVTNQVPPFS